MKDYVVLRHPLVVVVAVVGDMDDLVIIAVVCQVFRYRDIKSRDGRVLNNIS